MTHSTDTVAITIYPHPFIMKMSENQDPGNFLNMVKSIYEKSTAKIISAVKH